MQVDPDRLAALTNRAARLGELKETPAWTELRVQVQERKDAIYGAFLKRLQAGEPVDQREVDRTAGFFKGMETLLDYPDLADTRLRRALDRAEREERESSESD